MRPLTTLVTALLLAVLTGCSGTLSMRYLQDESENARSRFVRERNRVATLVPANGTTIHMLDGEPVNIGTFGSSIGAVDVAPGTHTVLVSYDVHDNTRYTKTVQHHGKNTTTVYTRVHVGSRSYVPRTRVRVEHLQAGHVYKIGIAAWSWQPLVSIETDGRINTSWKLSEDLSPELLEVIHRTREKAKQTRNSISYFTLEDEIPREEGIYLQREMQVIDQPK